MGFGGASKPGFRSGRSTTGRRAPPASPPPRAGHIPTRWSFRRCGMSRR